MKIFFFRSQCFWFSTCLLSRCGPSVWENLLLLLFIILQRLYQKKKKKTPKQQRRWYKFSSLNRSWRWNEHWGLFNKLIINCCWAVTLMCCNFFALARASNKLSKNISGSYDAIILFSLIHFAHYTWSKTSQHFLIKSMKTSWEFACVTFMWHIVICFISDYNRNYIS